MQHDSCGSIWGTICVWGACASAPATHLSCSFTHQYFLFYFLSDILSLIKTWLNSLERYSLRQVRCGLCKKSNSSSFLMTKQSETVTHVIKALHTYPNIYTEYPQTHIYTTCSVDAEIKVRLLPVKSRKGSCCLRGVLYSLVRLMELKQRAEWQPETERHNSSVWAQPEPSAAFSD